MLDLVDQCIIFLLIICSAKVKCFVYITSYTKPKTVDKICVYYTCRVKVLLLTLL